MFPHLRHSDVNAPAKDQRPSRNAAFLYLKPPRQSAQSPEVIKLPRCVRELTDSLSRADAVPGLLMADSLDAMDS